MLECCIGGRGERIVQGTHTCEQFADPLTARLHCSTTLRRWGYAYCGGVWFQPHQTSSRGSPESCH